MNTEHYFIQLNTLNRFQKVTKLGLQCRLYISLSVCLLFTFRDNNIEILNAVVCTNAIARLIKIQFFTQVAQKLNFFHLLEFNTENSRMQKRTQRNKCSELDCSEKNYNPFTRFHSTFKTNNEIQSQHSTLCSINESIMQPVDLTHSVRVF